MFLRVVCFISLFVFTSCASSKIEISKVVGNFNVTKTFIPNSQNVKMIGRSFFEENLLWLIYSGTGCEFYINAHRLDIVFAGDDVTKNNPNEIENPARVIVLVNGQRYLDELIFQEEQVFTIFNEEKIIEGVVQVIKISEAIYSSVGIKSLATDVDGIIYPTEERQVKMEFIGDSITCGYGIDDEFFFHNFSTSTEDVTKTYAFKTANRLNADYSFVCLSGWGIISGYTNNSIKNAEFVLPKYYEKMGFSYNSMLSEYPQQMNWNFNNFCPDIIVINLGTNDFSYCKKDAERLVEFENAYIEFLRKIRKLNPNAYILCTIEIMGDDLFENIQNAVTKFLLESNDEKIGTFCFESASLMDGLAADFHPTERTNEKAANALIKKIESLGLLQKN